MHEVDADIKKLELCLQRLFGELQELNQQNQGSSAQYWQMYYQEKAWITQQLTIIDTQFCQNEVNFPHLRSYRGFSRPTRGLKVVVRFVSHDFVSSFPVSFI